jgi:hypothetical protein
MERKKEHKKSKVSGSDTKKISTRDQVLDDSNNVDNSRIMLDDSNTSTIADYSGKSSSDQAPIVYKFQSRPPYEGFLLILVIVVVAILLIWWLNSKLKASEQ